MLGFTMCKSTMNSVLSGVRCGLGVKLWPQVSISGALNFVRTQALNPRTPKSSIIISLESTSNLNSTKASDLSALQILECPISAHAKSKLQC